MTYFTDAILVILLVNAFFDMRNLARKNRTMLQLFDTIKQQNAILAEYKASNLDYKRMLTAIIRVEENAVYQKDVHSETSKRYMN